MKKLIFLAILCTGLSVSAFAQPKNIIKANPLGLAFGSFNATYEGVISNSSSLLASANYAYSLLGVDVSIFGFGGAYRYYFTNKNVDVPTGFYVNPQINFDFGSAEDVNFNTTAFGFELGYQWAWESGFVLDLGLGPNWVNFGGDYEDVNFDDLDDGTIIWPSATLAIGFNF